MSNSLKHEIEDLWDLLPKFRDNMIKVKHEEMI